MDNQQILDEAPEGATHIEEATIRYIKVEEAKIGCGFEDWFIFDFDEGDWVLDDSYNVLLMRSLDDIKRIAELEKELNLTKDIIVAHQIADETGYIDGVGWVVNWSEMKKTVTKILEAHNLEQQNKPSSPRIGYIVDYGDGVSSNQIQWEYPEISKFSKAKVATFKEVIE